MGVASRRFSHTPRPCSAGVGTFVMGLRRPVPLPLCLEFFVLAIMRRLGRKRLVLLIFWFRGDCPLQSEISLLIQKNIKLQRIITMRACSERADDVSLRRVAGTAVKKIDWALARN